MDKIVRERARECENESGWSAPAQPLNLEARVLSRGVLSLATEFSLFLEVPVLSRQFLNSQAGPLYAGLTVIN